ncbi:MAG: hypothetical protein QM589_08225 [Thermomicrobiales bacterium]
MAISTGILPVSPLTSSPAAGYPARGRDATSYRLHARPLGATPAQEQGLRALEHWEAMRGQVLVNVPVMAMGTFPGSLRLGQMLDRAELTVSEFFFALDEGLEHGFAIPADDIVDLTIVPDPAGHMRALRIRYVADHADGCIQAFTIATTGFRRVARFKSILRLAAAADIAVTAFDPETMRPRSLAITWAHVRRFSSELMVWSGTACGPVGGWLASTRAECRVWMTTHSFFWCDVAGNGVNRLPIADILDVTMDIGAETPVVAIALRDAEGCRQEVLFGFDRREFGAHAEATCRSLVSALAQVGVAVRTEAPAFAPWLPGQSAELPTRLPTPAHRVRPEKPQPTDAGLTAIPHEVMAWLEAAEDTPAPDATLAAMTIVAGAIEEGDTGSAIAITPEQTEDAPAISDDPWARMDAFEAECLTAIRAYEAHAEVATTEQAVGLQEALAGLATLIEAGQIDLLDANARAQRLRGLAACRTSLRLLAQHQKAGIRSRSAILTERRAVLERVETLVS